MTSTAVSEITHAENLIMHMLSNTHGGQPVRATRIPGRDRNGPVQRTCRCWSNGIGVRVLGVSGCVRYNNAADHQWTQEEYAEQISRLPAADWVVTHCPPKGVNDHDDPNVGVPFSRLSQEEKDKDLAQLDAVLSRL